MTDTEISAGSEARPSGWARAKAALIPPTAAHWGWWAAGIGMGLTIATVAVTLAGRSVTSPAPAGGKAMEQAVKDAILAKDGCHEFAEKYFEEFERDFGGAGFEKLLL